MRETDFTCYSAAKIIDNGGNSSTFIVCKKSGNDTHFVVAEVDLTGKTVQDVAGKLQRTTLEDLSEGGVQVLHHPNDNPIVAPGDEIEIGIGSHTVRVVGKHGNGVEVGNV